MHDNKIYASDTTWPQEHFIRPAPILTLFLKRHQKDFRLFPAKEKSMRNFKS